MGYKDDFDLDVTFKNNGGDVNPNITSVSYCTPGTCWNTCNGTATLNTNCCLGSLACSLAESCRK